MRVLFCLLIVFSLNVFAQSKDYLLVLSSQRNAETLAEAGRLFQLDHPDLPIVARSDIQLSEMTDQQLKILIANSRGVLGIGLFGGSVSRLSPLIDNAIPKGLC